jgi:hypothetical protein
MTLERREVTTNTSTVFVVGSFHDPASPAFKANLHCHSTHSDGKLSPQEVADLYAGAGYQILCIADHTGNGDQDGDGVHDWNLDGVVMPRARQIGKGHKPHKAIPEDYGREAYVRDYTRTSAEQGRPWVEENWKIEREGELLMLPGFEDHHTGPHVVVNGYPIHTQGSDIARFRGTLGYREVTQQAGGVVYLPHPHEWDDDPAFFLDHPELRRFDGIEVVNGNAMRNGKQEDPAGTRGFARRLWDAILSARVSCWGYGNDDMHTLGLDGGAGPFVAWTDLWAESLSLADVLRALRTGSFCVSSGVTVSSLTLEGDRICVTTENASRIRFIGCEGRTLLEVEDSAAQYRIAGDEVYVRVECENDGLRWPDEQPDLGQWAFCQPLWIFDETQEMPEGLPLTTTAPP